jgi:hypothetical protein
MIFLSHQNIILNLSQVFFLPFGLLGLLFGEFLFGENVVKFRGWGQKLGRVRVRLEVRVGAPLSSSCSFPRVPTKVFVLVSWLSLSTCSLVCDRVFAFTF